MKTIKKLSKRILLIKFKTHSSTEFQTILYTIKQFEGRRFDNNIKAWTVPNTPDNINKLKSMNFKVKSERSFGKIIIILSNNFIKICGQYEDLISINNEFVFDDMSYCFVGGKFDPNKIYRKYMGKIKNEALFLPIGFYKDLMIYIEKEKIRYEFADTRKDEFEISDKEIKGNLHYLELYDYQIEAVKICIEKKNAIIKLPTSSGKTEIFLSLCNLMKVKTLIVFNSISLAQQTFQRAEKAKLDVGIIQGTNIDEDHKIVMCTIQSRHKIKNEYEMIICDECFVYETLIITDRGLLQIGDIVENKIECRILSYNINKKTLSFMKINNYIKNNSTDLMSIKHKAGNLICTKNHKIWSVTDGKYKKAEQISIGEEMCVVQQKIYSENKMQRENFLHQPLCKQMDKFSTGNKSKTKKNIKSARKQKKIFSKFKKIQTIKKRFGGIKKIFRIDEKKQSNEQFRNIKKDVRYKKEKWNSSYLERKKRWQWSIHKTTIKIKKIIRKKLDTGRSSCSNLKSKKKIKHTKPLQNRHSQFKIKNRNRSGWQRTQVEKQKRKRYKKNEVLETIRVEDIKILELGYNGKSRNGNETNTVYNLEIDKNHNYFANGILVSNCHKARSSSYHKLLKKSQFKYRFGFSATPFIKDKYKNALVKKWIGDIEYTLGAEKLIRENKIADPNIKIIEVTSPHTISDLKWPEIEQKGIIENSYRNGMICKVAMDNEFVLILIKKIKHGKILEQMIPNSMLIYGEHKSDVREMVVEKFKKGQIILIASTIFDEGISIKTIKNLIIASGGSSQIKSIQRLGRGLRIDEGKRTVNIFDFMDVTNHILERHSKNRISDYKKEGFKNIEFI